MQGSEARQMPTTPTKCASTIRRQTILAPHLTPLPPAVTVVRTTASFSATGTLRTAATTQMPAHRGAGDMRKNEGTNAPSVTNGFRARVAFAYTRTHTLDTNVSRTSFLTFLRKPFANVCM